MKISDMALTANSKKLNKVVESRFGGSFNYKGLTVEKASKLVEAMDAGIISVRKSHAIHHAEKNAKYMEVLMVREGLVKWLAEHGVAQPGTSVAKKAKIVESETAKSEAILATRDIVDTIQDMMEKIGRMQNEQMPALLDALRDQIGAEQADTFRASVDPILNGLEEQLRTGRETIDSAARTLAGEQISAPMDMPTDDTAAPEEAPMDDLDMDAEADADEFAATDAATGGTDDAGREERA
mgnify:CR=1 FL=1|jgi:hypothetical protein